MTDIFYWAVYHWS